MLNWFKRRDDAALLDALNRVAVALEDIRDRLGLDQKAVEDGIFNSLKERLLKENPLRFEGVKQQGVDESNRLVLESESLPGVVGLSSDVNKESDHHPVLQFLQGNGIRVIKYSENISKYAHLTGMIQHMGNKYDDIAKFLKQLKISLNSSKKRRICMRNWSDAEISSSCQLALSMLNNGLLEDYKYLKSPVFEMIFQPSRNPDVINFLTGEWLECYIRSFVEAHLRLQQVDYTLAANPIIMLPNGRQFEMDLLIKTDRDFLWIEIKSGEYKSYLTKYEEVGKLLQIPPENRFLILANEQDAVCESLGRSRQMNVLNLNMLKREISGIVRNLHTDLVQAG